MKLSKPAVRAAMFSRVRQFSSHCLALVQRATGTCVHIIVASSAGLTLSFFSPSEVLAFIEFTGPNIRCSSLRQLPVACYTPSTVFDGPEVHCPTEPLAPFCELGQPKEWLPEERKILTEAFAFLQRPGLKWFWRQLENANIRVLNRMANQVHVKPNGEIQQLPATAEYFPESNTIVFFDLFFERLRHWERELSSNENKRALLIQKAAETLLHEFAHAYERNVRNKLAEDCGFRSAIQEGFQFSNIFEQITPGAVTYFNTEVLPLNVSGQVRRANEKNESFGRALGFPSAYSLFHPLEAFAEILTYLELDPLARNYLRPEIVRWFDERVFTSDSSGPERCKFRNM